MILAWILIAVGCSKDNYQYFPNVSVNITLSIPTDLSLLGIGSAMICPIQGGVKGIIIYRSDLNTYEAFDRLCTYYPKDTCAVVLEKATNLAKCPCCNSVFIFNSYGCAVFNGPAPYPLKQYTTMVDGNHLYINN